MAVQGEAKTTRHRHLFTCIPEPVHESARASVCACVRLCEFVSQSVRACLVTAARVCTLGPAQTNFVSSKERS